MGLSAFRCTTDADFVNDEQGLSGSITRFVSYQGYLYALNLNEALTYSLQNPDKPKLAHRLQLDYGLETIIVYDGTIFIGSRTALYILAIENPAAPRLLARSQRPEILEGGCDPVVVKGDHAYSTIKIIENICGRISARSALLAYDVSDKTNPRLVADFPLNQPNGLGYSATNYLFVCDEGSDRVEVFDISQPNVLKLTSYGFALTDPVDLIVKGDWMIVSAKTEFNIYDISDMTSIRKIGQFAK